MTSPLASPETLTHSRSGDSAERSGTVPADSRSAVPPLYRAERGTVPGTKSKNWLAEKVDSRRRAARPGPCPRCDAPTLVGPDHDHCAITVRVDQAPVDPVTEAAAVLSGRYSCELVRGCLWHRDSFRLESPRRPYPVHLEHRCPPQPERTLF